MGLDKDSSRITLYRHLMAGEQEAALHCLQARFNDHGLWARTEREDARLDPLREDPRLVELLARVEQVMAEQLSRIRHMEETGEFAPVPKLLLEAEVRFREERANRRLGPGPQPN